MANTIISGYIAADGTITSGSGFSVQHDPANDKGVYYVNFDQAFDDTPAVTVGLVKTDFSGPWFLYSVIKGLDESGFEVIFVGADHKSKNDTAFTFIASGV